MTRGQSDLADAVVRFLSALQGAQRESSQEGVNKFVRWSGKDRSPSELTPLEVAEYAERQVQPVSGTNPQLDSVRAFLTYLKKEGFIARNLAVHLRVRKGTERRKRREPQVQEHTEPIQLTSEGYYRLNEELEALKRQRPLITEQLKKAMADKDFRENAPLDAARDQQAQVEARIRDLEAALKPARQTENEPQGEEKRVRLGSRVKLRELSDQKEVTYTLVSPVEVDPRAGKISFNSPLGRVLRDHVSGQEVEVNAPGGLLRYRIEQVEAK